MDKGFILKVTISDQQGELLDELFVNLPANTINRAAYKIRDALEMYFDTLEDGRGL
jgi:hypothetical protein